MKKTGLSILMFCALFSVFTSAAFADTVYYACAAKDGSIEHLSVTPIHCPPHQFLISWGQTAAHASGLIANTSVQICPQWDILGDCGSNNLITLGLVEGQQMILDYLPNNSGPPNTPQVVDQFVVTKQSGPTGTPNDFSVNFVVTQAGFTPSQFQISPSVPVYSTLSDLTCIENPSSCPVQAVATLLSDSLVSIAITGVGQVKVVASDSVGAIKSATLTYYKGAREGTLTAVIWNAGAYPASFITTAQIAGVIPVAAQSQTLNIEATATLTFKLQAISGPFGSGNTGTVTLLSSTGTVYDSVVVTPVEIPEPQK